MLMPVTADQALEISYLCKSIMSIDKRIICVSVVSNRGKIIDSEFRTNMFNLSAVELEMLYMQRTLQSSMIREFDCRLGRWGYTVTDRDFITEIIIPLDDGTIFVAVESSIKTHELVPKLQEIIETCFDVDTKTGMSTKL